MAETDTLFHLAFPVHDLAAARDFYGGVLGCPEGRSSEHWIDFFLYGHQVVAHLQPGRAGVAGSNPVDNHDVPVPHFGVILSPAQFEDQTPTEIEKITTPAAAAALSQAKRKRNK